MEKKYVLRHKEYRLEYTLVRSARKTVGISVNREGGIKVAAPLKVSAAEIERIVREHCGWILQKQQQMKNLPAAQAKKLENGEVLLYLGGRYTLKLVDTGDRKTARVFIQGSEILAAGPWQKTDPEERRNRISEALTRWYMEQFKELAESQIQRYAPVVGARPQRIIFRNQKTRWGSCSGKGTISLNWRLIMAPPAVIEYVVVHELCHLKKMSHSREFWKLVQNILPHHEECRAWLKQNGYQLAFL